jgi:hypothetical protein
LLAVPRDGITVVPATVDGGTNALAMTPPDAGECLFGLDSARRHLTAAHRRGFEAALLPLPGFARNIDTVDDVLWLPAAAGRDRTAMPGSQRHLRAPAPADKAELSEEPEKRWKVADTEGEDIGARRKRTVARTRGRRRLSARRR